MWAKVQDSGQLRSQVCWFWTRHIWRHDLLLLNAISNFPLEYTISRRCLYLWKRLFQSLKYCLIVAVKPQFSSVQSLSHVWLFATPWTAALQASLSFTISWSSLKLMSIELVMPASHLILYRPLLLPPSVFLSIRVFSNEPILCIRWTKYWGFSFSLSPFNEHSGLISFRIDWFDLLVLKSLLQHHNLKASILWRSAFFTVQLSHPYMTTGKTIALTLWAFVGNVMSLLF